MPDWVEPLPLPAPDPAMRERPIQTLLYNSQTRYTADHQEQFTQIAAVAQTTQGLSALGSIALPWQPDQSELIIHRVQIVRNGAVIDLLADGREFAVLRRESNLESAILDGVLTAAMQAEGLAVGDVLDIAFTLRRRGGILPLRGESNFFIAPTASARRVYVRHVWPRAIPIRWRGTGPLERARTRTSRHGNEVIVDLANVAGEAPPADAPPRFSLPAMLQATQFRDWGEISAMVAPHYEQASRIAPDSPLQAQIGRIAATSSEPAVRALAALRLVQDEVRYVALLMGQGNFLPASADETWTRRYGDCKGKTTLLLALLRGLGIEAEPMVVNIFTGDALPQTLPQLGAFNHVIVRATIGGRVYFLDGTRTGDRDLAELAVSPFRFGLSLRVAGGALEALPYAPPLRPLMEIETTYDARQGFASAVPVTVEWRYRGDAAIGFRRSLAQVGRVEFIRQVREGITLPGDEGVIENFDLRDEPDGAFVLRASGKSRMNLRPSPGGATRRFRFGNGTISWERPFERLVGPERTAPVALAMPVSIAETETILLPDAGRDFSLDGRSFDRTVAGTRISRELSLSADRAVARSAFIRLEQEISAAAARDAIPILNQINDDEAYLRAPLGTDIAPRATTLESGGPSEQASAHIRTGYDMMGSHRSREALAEFDRAIALSADSSLAHANRAVALTHLNRLVEAEEAAATALRLNANEFVAHQGLGYLRLRQDRETEAVAALTRALELETNNVFALGHRATAFARLARFEDALADFARILSIEPRHHGAMLARAQIFAHLGRADEALAAIDAAVAIDSRNPGLAITRADLLEQVGRSAEVAEARRVAMARVEAASGPVDGGDYNYGRATLLAWAGRVREAITMADAHLRRFPDTVITLAERCMLRTNANLELDLALRDCNRALQLEPGHPIALPARGLLYLHTRRWAEARRDFDAILATETNSPLALYGRGLARRAAGDAAGGDQDAAQARRFDFAVDFNFSRRGFDTVPRASPAGRE